MRPGTLHPNAPRPAGQLRGPDGPDPPDSRPIRARPPYRIGETNPGRYGNTNDMVRKDRVGRLSHFCGKYTITRHTALPTGHTVLTPGGIKAPAAKWMADQP